MAPASGTPYRVIVPVELPDIAMLSEGVTPDILMPYAGPDVITPDIVTSGFPTLPFIALGAGGQ
jgi:hypothetical protein